MTERIKLHNTNKTMPVEVFAADGESVSILPGAKPDVDKKFTWNLPSDVVVFRQKHTVFGEKGGKEINNKKGAKENAVPLDTPRATVKSV